MVPLTSETFNGFVGGVQGGYNWQAGVFVLGVEGDLEPIRKLLESDKSDVIPCRALDSAGGAPDVET